MKYLRWIAGMLFLISISQHIVAQSVDGSIRPIYSFAYKYSDRLTLNGKLTFQTAAFDFSSNAAFEHIEPQLLFAWGLTPRVKIGGGYFYRHTNPLEDNPGFEHRLVQQFAWIGFIGDRRIAHRIRLEQRFRDIPNQQRLRYRLSYDFPLQGEKLNNKEWYAVIKNEWVNALTEKNYAAENRIALSVGWFRDSGRKAELGVEYRLREILSDENPINHYFLFTTSFYLTR